MRIGIITFHCAYNYGSALQTYALKRFLEKNGEQVSVVHFLSSDFRVYRLIRLHKNPMNYLRDIAYFIPNKRRADAFHYFWTDYFNLTEKYTNHSDFSALNSRFDAFICGSDQIWNLDCTQGIIEPFFLSFAEKRRIAYAPSLGHAEFHVSFDEALLRTLLQRFDAISVREEGSIPFLRKYYDGEIETVVDPTLLLEAEDYRAIEASFPINGTYIIDYELHEVTNEQTEFCFQTAQQRDLKIVYFTVGKRFGDRGVSAYGCSPGQWLWLIKHAEYVVSNSFHATVFSILFHRPFKVFLPSRSYPRILSLTELFCSETFVNGEKPPSSVTMESYPETNENLNRLIMKSKKYLLRMIQHETGCET